MTDPRESLRRLVDLAIAGIEAAPRSERDRQRAQLVRADAQLIEALIELQELRAAVNPRRRETVALARRVRRAYDDLRASGVRNRMPILQVRFGKKRTWLRELLQMGGEAPSTSPLRSSGLKVTRIGRMARKEVLNPQPQRVAQAHAGKVGVGLGMESQTSLQAYGSAPRPKAPGFEPPREGTGLEADGKTGGNFEPMEGTPTNMAPGEGPAK